MFPRLRSRIAAGITVIGLVGAGTLLAATPANAAPGDASAYGGSASLDASLLGISVLDVDVTQGAVAAPPDDAENLVGVALVGDALANISLGALSTSATSSPTGSAASASVEDASLNLFGVDVLTLDTASADVVCRTGGTPTAVADVVGLSVFGIARTLDAGAAVTAVSDPLGTVNGVDLSGVRLTVTVEQVEDTTSTPVVASALVVTVGVTGALGPVPIVGLSGTVTLAHAECEAPNVLPVTATGINPNAGPTTGGQTVTITGTNFTPSTTVDFGGTAGTAVTPNADGTSLTVLTPAHAAGAITVSVANPGTAPATLGYTYFEPVTAATINPNAGPTTGGQTVTITGTGFTPQTTVDYGGAPGTTVTPNAAGTSLTVVTPAHAAGPVTVSVANPGTQPATLGYTYFAPVTAATITPNVGPTSGGQTVTITGTGFTPQTTVDFGGAAGTTVTPNADGTSLTVVTPAHAAGAVTVSVANPGTPPATLDYTYVPTTVASISPTTGPTYGGTPVTISGTGLNTTTGVTFDGVPATDVLASPDGTQVTATSPAGTGSVDVVITRTGGGTVTAAEQFVYVAPAVSDVNPDAGPVAGGTSVTITGTGLEGTTGVTIGGQPAPITSVSADGTQVVVTTPPGVAGPADVTIELPGDDVVITDGFLYVAVPTATGATPGEGPTTGGTGVVVDGTGFVPGATTVTICGVTVSSSDVVVDRAGTRLRFVTPACAAGATTIVATTPGGTTSALAFRYVAASNGGGGALASTGGSAPTPFLAGSAILLTLGLLTAVGARRRRA